MPQSIVARTTLSILALTIATSFVFAAVAAWRVETREHQRADERLGELLSTVESTTRIACFLKDRVLAKEIAQGLLSNSAVASVRIVADGETLYGSPGAEPAPANSTESEVVSRKIYSPFKATEQVGEIALRVASAEIHAQVYKSSRDAAFVLGLEIAFVGVAVAIVVFFLITQPIRGISDELHKLKIDAGSRLRIPPHNQSDEIGRLVVDVNSLIASLTELLGSERELRVEHEMSERKMQLIFEKTQTGIFVLHTDGILQSWNPAFMRILGSSIEAAQGAGVIRLQTLLAPHGQAVDDLIGSCMSTNASCDVELEIGGSDTRRSVWVEVSLNPIGPALVQGVVNDVTAHKRAEFAAQERASHDDLTGLLNRQGLNSILASLFARQTSEMAPALALLQVDLDDFKRVNDTYGHEAGDRVLQRVARVLERCVRRGDLLARQGGDEFVAVLIAIEGSAKALEIANNIIAAIRQPIDIGGGNHALVGASVGIALASGIGIAPEELLRRADAAMYAAKRAGRGRACLTPMEPAAPASVAAA